jgi:DNA-binding IclR family transcriptional regulator
MNQKMVSNIQSDGLVQTLDKALILLKYISKANDPLPLADLINETHLNRTTAWRLLLTLEYHGFVERDQLTKGYRLGYWATKLSLGTSRNDWLVRQARPSLERLAQETQETVMLSVPYNYGVVAIDQIDPPHHVRLVDYVHMVLPLHCTSNGKLMLASLSETELDNFLKHPMEKRTAWTNTDPEKLLAEIETTRHRGFATSYLEFDESENGLSAPVYDMHENMIAFISLSGPSFRLSRELIDSYASLVIEMANEITKQIND